MTRPEKIKVSRGGDFRDYTIWYADDPPDRQEAVAFFQTHAACLFPAIDLPPAVDAMTVEDANEFLRAHPVQKQWAMLRIRRNDAIVDEDLTRLRFLPELERVHISAHITDNGVRHLLLLPALEGLVLYSDRVTNQCLDFVRRMKKLRQVDFQGSPGVTPTAFDNAVRSMTPTPESWPPPGVVEQDAAPDRSGE